MPSEDRKPNAERVRYFAQRLTHDLAQLSKALEGDWEDPEGGPRLEVGTQHLSPANRWSINTDLHDLRTAARTLRDHAAIMAKFLDVADGEVPPKQLERIVEWAATKLAEEGEPVAADALRDPEVVYDAKVEFSGEEPRGFGADPYGRPDPMTHPEAWTE